MSAETGLDRRLLAIASVVILGAIMSILDTTIVNVAIRTLARDFHSPLSTIQWVSTGYMLALAIVIPITGWASDRFGTKRLYMTSIALFLAGSALSGAAWSAESLIVFRVLQGLGGGMIMPVAMTILTRASGPQRVGRVMSVIGVPMLLGPVFGPVLGGWLVDDFSWRWIFYVNLPIGALALPLAWRILDADSPQPAQRLDLLGLALLSPGLAGLVYGLAETSSTGGVGSARALIGLVAGAALVVAFALHARRASSPLLDLRLFEQRAFAAGAATTFLLGAALFGAMILLPLYYQVVRGESALSAGLLTAPQGLGAALAMPLSGRLTDRGGAGRVVLAGLALVLIGTFAYTQLDQGSSYALLAVSLLVRGMGIGATMMPAMSAAYQTLDQASIARASSMLNIVSRIGGSIGTALLAVVLEQRLRAAVPGSHGGLGEAAGAHAGPLVAGAFATTFWWAFAMTAAAYFPAWLLPRIRRGPDAGAAERLRDAISVEG
ncbi:MAG TPA: DHA2 family efflux MFS transporter permease subunit [Solirubrobacteraceae bacterium]|nr:DHA2 family efflux MFS transporter permease subunit [Solirubrobacteraceae bacterium]